LVRWMEPEGFSRFADLNASALRRFQLSIERRTNQQGARLARTTVQKYLDLLVYMHRYRADIGDGLTVDPCSGQSSGAVAGVTEFNRGAWPYTPDVIAVPLVQGAIQFISHCALDLLRAREMYAREIETQQHRGCSAEVWRKSAIRVLQQVTLDTPKGPHTIESGADLAELLDVLYTACFIVISYLVGPRASEILQLQSGCLQPFGADDSGGDTPVAMIVARSSSARRLIMVGITSGWHLHRRPMRSPCSRHCRCRIVPVPAAVRSGCGVVAAATHSEPRSGNTHALAPCKS